MRLKLSNSIRMQHYTILPAARSIPRQEDVGPGLMLNMAIIISSFQPAVCVCLCVFWTPLLCTALAVCLGRFPSPISGPKLALTVYWGQRIGLIQSSSGSIYINYYYIFSQLLDIYQIGKWTETTTTCLLQIL